MNPFIQFSERLKSKLDIAYALIRIYIGVALFVRGAILMANPDAIVALVSDDKLHMWYSYITIGHLLGGFLLALGLFVRLGALLQIPILVGAVLISRPEQGLMMGGQSFELASLVLFLLFVIFVFGSGPLALDLYFRNKNSGKIHLTT